MSLLKTFSRLQWLPVLMILPALGFAADAVRDGGITISEPELQRIIDRWPSDLREMAASDLGVRMELINAALMGRKMAAELDGMTPEKDGKAYWIYRDKLLTFKRQQRISRFQAELQYPDMEALARERYETEKDKYAKVPEKRLTSHILFRCFPGQCERQPVRDKAAELVAELRNGADFEAMVSEYSDDAGSKAKGGLFDRWMQIGEKGVVPTYSGGAFEIAEIGDYSDPVDSEFGIHIIRLDDIRPQHYKPYEEVREAIVDDLQKEYRKLALKDFQASYNMTDDGYINGDILDKLLAPYKK
ncbi:MAG: peptidylprolyl isomerase [Parahaliea sp.]